MAEATEILIRPAQPADVPGLAVVFAAAFAESVVHVAGTLETNRGLEDMFILALQAEPGALWVAEDQERVAGYVLAPARTSRLRTVAIWRGHLFRSAWRWLTGQYGVRWRALVISLGDKLSFLRNGRVGEASEARILSMAVHPDYQGRGLGKRLLAAGLDHLRERKVPTIRLEVRPTNTPAKRIYEQAGFAAVGEYADAQGPWLVMIKHLQPHPRTRHLQRRRKTERWTLMALAAVVAVWGLGSFLPNRRVFVANARLRAKMPFLDVPKTGQRVLVFAPHPDDETLGCAGFIQQAQAAGAEVTVALMTNGDASEYALMYAEKDLVGTPRDYLTLGRLRQRESQAGLGVLGVPPARLLVLGYPNGGLDQLLDPAYWLPANLWTSPRTRVNHDPYPGSFHPNAPYCGSQVLADVQRVLAAVTPDVILAPAPFDVHPDHWATYDFVRLALAEGYPGQESRAPRLYTYLVHRKDWPAPVGYRPHHLLEPPAALAGMSRLHWFALPLSDEEVGRKTRALSMYRSQGVRYDRLLLALARHNELFCQVEPPPPNLPEVSIMDAIRDQLGLRKPPGSDLAVLSLRVQPAGVRVSLMVEGLINPHLTYAIMGHSPLGGGPVAWELRVVGQKGTLTWVQNGTVHRQTVPATVQQDVLSANLPAGLAEGHLLLVEAYVSAGRGYLDHTIAQTVVLAPPKGTGEAS